MKTYKFFNGYLDFPVGLVPSEIKAIWWSFQNRDDYGTEGSPGTVLFFAGEEVAERRQSAQFSVLPGWFVMEKDE